MDAANTTPSALELARQLVEMTAAEASELLAKGEQAVGTIDREARDLWDRIVVLMTGKDDPMIGMQSMPRLVPEAVPMMFRETQRACEVLRVDMQEYFRGQIAGLMGRPVAVPADENLKHTIVGVKGMHGQAIAVHAHLRQRTS